MRRKKPLVFKIVRMSIAKKLKNDTLSKYLTTEIDLGKTRSGQTTLLVFLLSLNRLKPLALWP